LTPRRTRDLDRQSENSSDPDCRRARDVYAQRAPASGIDVTGVDMHIGSQITDLEPYDNAAARLRSWPAT
jgi:diaminopimelate decarboxylase